MTKWTKRLAPATLIGFLLVGPGDCSPDAALGPVGELRPQSTGNPVGATDPDGDPSQPRPIQRLQRTSR